MYCSYSMSRTTFVPLDTAPLLPPPSPAFLTPCSDRNLYITRVLKATMKAKRLVIVCGEFYVSCEIFFHWALSFVKGAGISVQAGIPCFRSPEGLFQTLRRENPQESMSSGKDLFDASVFKVSVFFFPCGILMIQSFTVPTLCCSLSSNDSQGVDARSGCQTHFISPCPSLLGHAWESPPSVHAKYRCH